MTVFDALRGSDSFPGVHGIYMAFYTLMLTFDLSVGPPPLPERPQIDLKTVFTCLVLVEIFPLV